MSWTLIILKFFRASAHKLVGIVMKALILGHGIHFVRNVIRRRLSIADIFESFDDIVDLIGLAFTAILCIVGSFGATEAERERWVSLGA